MASALSHAVAGLAIGTAFWRPGVPAPFWVAGAAVATLPDLDSIGFRFGVAYGDMLGHRGLTHSLVFAALLGAGVVAVAFPSGAGSVSRSQLWLYLFLATASHGVLDALTNGGLGVAFFAPFDNARYFFPLTPIQVSPINVRAFFTERGLRVLTSELLWVWLPSVLFATAALWLRRRQLVT
ncbi:MAG TPA: metal-dependent hydrolase [Gemmatimonadales bacterium]|nr:metal-dependent hydrolase [Gemmatimonadales bacterium]